MPVIFGLKIPNRFGEMSENPKGGFFYLHHVAFLNMVRIVQGRYE